MRNAVEIGNGLVVTTDNSGGIGEKPADVVSASDQVTAYFAARVALLEQWAAHAEPISVLIHNFTGEDSWNAYVEGVAQAFDEAGCELPPVTGSTETNMALLQSAVAVTMIGEKQAVSDVADLEWYVFGAPLVGNEVLEKRSEIASPRAIKEAIDTGIVNQIWPVGSAGILAEYRRLTGDSKVEIETAVDIRTSAGPSTSVLIGMRAENSEKAHRLLGGPLYKIHEINSFRNER